MSAIGDYVHYTALGYSYRYLKETNKTSFYTIRPPHITTLNQSMSKMHEMIEMRVSELEREKEAKKYQENINRIMEDTFGYNKKTGAYKITPQIEQNLLSYLERNKPSLAEKVKEGAYKITNKLTLRSSLTDQKFSELRDGLKELLKIDNNIEAVKDYLEKSIGKMRDSLERARTDIMKAQPDNEELQNMVNALEKEANQVLSDLKKGTFTITKYAGMGRGGNLTSGEVLNLNNQPLFGLNFNFTEKESVGFVNRFYRFKDIYSKMESIQTGYFVEGALAPYILDLLVAEGIEGVSDKLIEDMSEFSQELQNDLSRFVGDSVEGGIGVRKVTVNTRFVDLNRMFKKKKKFAKNALYEIVLSKASKGKADLRVSPLYNKKKRDLDSFSIKASQGNISSSHIFQLDDGSSLFQLLSDWNTDTDFGNHFLNLYSEHRNEIPEGPSAWSEVLVTAKQIALLTGLVGYKRMGTSGQAEFLLIKDSGKSNTPFRVIDMATIYSKIAKNIELLNNSVTFNGLKDSFPLSPYRLEGKNNTYRNRRKMAKTRITDLLMQMHAVKMKVTLKSSLWKNF